MNRIEMTQEAARRLASTKNSKAAYDQCLYDFEMGADFGCSLTIKRAADTLVTCTNYSMLCDFVELIKK